MENYDHLPDGEIKDLLIDLDKQIQKYDTDTPPGSEINVKSISGFESKLEDIKNLILKRERKIKLNKLNNK